MTDESGNAIGSLRYSPFGERVESTGLLPFMGFTGEPQAPGSDLTYLRARYYHPELGRFITADSIIPDPTNGQAWNRYAYVYNDVTNWTDPSGHDGVPTFEQFTNHVTSTSLWQNGWHPGMQCECQGENPFSSPPGALFSGTIAPGLTTFTLDSMDRLFRGGVRGVSRVAVSMNKVEYIQISKTLFNRITDTQIHNRVHTFIEVMRGYKNSGYDARFAPALKILNGKVAGGVIGGTMQGFFDLFDCSLSLPEQVLRIGIVFTESAMIAGLVGAIGIGGGVGVLVSVIIIFELSYYTSLFNEQVVFPAINQISPTPRYP